jgi:hypothetical protein
MRLAVIYDPQCPKLTERSYSATYADMMFAVWERFTPYVQTITDSCSAKDIDADVILIYDIHSSRSTDSQTTRQSSTRTSTTRIRRTS